MQCHVFLIFNQHLKLSLKPKSQDFLIFCGKLFGDTADEFTIGFFRIMILKITHT